MGGSASSTVSKSSASPSSPATEAAKNTAATVVVTPPAVVPPPPVATVEVKKEPIIDVATIVPFPTNSQAVTAEVSNPTPVSVVKPAEPAPVVPTTVVTAPVVTAASELGTLNIYYGTSTGTAMGYARTLAKEGNQKGFKARAIDLEDLDPTSLADNTSSSLSIFVMATAGEGIVLPVLLVT